MWVRHRYPGFADYNRPFLQRSAFGGLALLIVVVIVAQFDAFVSGLTSAVPISAVFVAGSFATGWFVARSARAERADRFTLATEFATRNVAIATAIAVTLLRRVDFAVFATTYFLTELPLMLAATAVFRARTAKAG
jgi:bile acid:Na+ symporter, BASS family